MTAAAVLGIVAQLAGFIGCIAIVLLTIGLMRRI